MPYAVITNAEGCDGFAVVKKGETKPVDGGCHDTRVKAMAHMAALNMATADEMRYDPDQPRDADGKFGSGGGGGEGSASTQKSDKEAYAGQAEYKDQLTADDYAALRMYSLGSSSVNDPLRRPDKHDERERARAEEKARTLDRIIANAPPLPEDVVVYRGIDGKRAQAAVTGAKWTEPNELGAQFYEPTSGHTFTDKAFVSTSSSALEASNFVGKSGAVLRIRVPAGTRALRVGGDSIFRGEKEVLLGRNTTMRVIGKSSDGRYVNMEVVP